MSGDLALKHGSRIGVIGGGPAGSLFAHFAQKLARRIGPEVSITIFDGKNFLQKGPQGCNLCAGVIAESLNERLEEEGIHLPESRIISHAEGYVLHTGEETLHLSWRDYLKGPISCVFRGNGPRYSSFPDVVSFDDFLLSWAQDQNTRVIPYPVWDIERPSDRHEPLVLVYGKKDRPKRFEADLVVGAFGVNTYLMDRIRRLGFGYLPPFTLKTYQAEFKLGRTPVSARFADNIHVYLPRSKTIRYATITPKGDYITLTLIGKKDATPELLVDFLKLPEIREAIPLGEPRCSCFPRIPVSPAKKPFSDKLVIIGDASFSRHYKNGLESAFFTAKLAAETVFQVGLDDRSFSRHFYRRAKDIIVDDNRYGRALFFLNDVIASMPLLARAHLSLTKKNRNTRSSEKVRYILWHMFTGNIPYRKIFRALLDIPLQISLMSHTIALLYEQSKHLIRKSFTRSKDAKPSRPA